MQGQDFGSIALIKGAICHLRCIAIVVMLIGEYCMNGAGNASKIES